jgi:hypothetical protein
MLAHRVLRLTTFMRPPIRYAPLSAEQKFWVRRLPRFLAPSRPSRFVRALHQAFVVPSMLFVGGSAEYQLYLAVIFHRSRIAQVGHFLCVPLGIIALLGLIAQSSPSFALATGALMTLYWTLVGALHRQSLWALCNAIVGAVLTSVALVLEWPVHPAVVMVIIALLQSASHTTERYLPPRVATASTWVRLRDYLRGPRLSVHILVSIRQWLYGTFDEWWATPRLVHLGTLVLLSRFGYESELKARVDRYARDAIASGEPALDYIGEGGGTYLDPSTLEPRA